MQGRYTHLNLRWNPFGEATPEERAELAHVDVEQFRDALQPGFAIELRAEHGRGKSTTLLALRKAFAPQAPHFRGSQQQNATLPIAPWVFLDEVQQINLFKLWSFARQIKQQNGTVVYSTHQNRRWLFKMAGLSTQQFNIDYSQPKTLLSLFSKRIAWAHNHCGTPPALQQSDIQKLNRLYGNDIRSMEGHLYDCINRLKHPEQPILPRNHQ